ncbi:tRNA 2-thiouridylase [Steroidobacter denitrificans]|uniref:tRNA-specific 2-thiouridylase MnmA n=1 Tax=Steroidobacter denitrificans TaxID=465721 RepID=A0A127F9J1_STEDE|nr:tRNA 2-thiouridine(34) synthase MnmA [Steroidobacter denitrificans]AMN47077.1 tRNA 2-thiouridylase [Steroidobacter denitrificans]
MTAPLVIVGMSGGVDSSVAAWLLQQQGYAVQGLFMSNWDEDEDGYCTAAQDFQDAREVCERLGIVLHKVSFAGEYRERVFAHFLAEYQAGRTPNPDVLCNREIKFGVCFEYARRLGAERVATGHYARVEHVPAGVRLLKGIDTDKDQSYFLHGIDAAALAHTLFPLGGLRKREVRRLALEQALPVFDKKDSTGICFIGERPFAEFLQRYLPAQPGEIRTLDGRRLGEHRGLMYYTLGQRQGLRIGGRRDAGELPWYVAAKDVAGNVLIVVQGHDHPALLCSEARVARLTWIAGAAPAERFRCGVKVRYRQPDQPCTVEIAPNGGAYIAFDMPQRAVTPGQYAVFYDADVCLGGGVIESAGPCAGQGPGTRQGLPEGAFACHP